MNNHNIDNIIRDIYQERLYGASAAASSSSKAAALASAYGSGAATSGNNDITAPPTATATASTMSASPFCHQLPRSLAAAFAARASAAVAAATRPPVVPSSNHFLLNSAAAVPSTAANIGLQREQLPAIATSFPLLNSSLLKSPQTRPTETDSITFSSAADQSFRRQQLQSRQVGALPSIFTSSNIDKDSTLLKELEQFNDEFQERMASTKGSTSINSQKFSRYFPMILYKLLMEKKYTSIINWCPGGKACIIYDIEKFEEVVMGNYFAHCNIESFQRQLRRYKFYTKKSVSVELSNGSNNNEEARQRTAILLRHENFMRGEEELCKRLCQEKGKTKRLSEAISKTAPQKHLTSKVLPSGSLPPSALVASKLQRMRNSIVSGPTVTTEMDEEDEEEFPEVETKTDVKEEQEAATIVLPSLVSSLDTLADVAAGTYQQQIQRQRPLKKRKAVAPPEEMMVAPQHVVVNLAHQEALEIASEEALPRSMMKYNKHFPVVLYNLLMEHVDASHPRKMIIDWSEDGKSFVIHDVNKFEKEIMGHYFMTCNIDSFQRQLRRYKFTQKSGNTIDPASCKRIRTIYAANEKFIRGNKQLCFLLCVKDNKKNCNIGKAEKI